MHMERPRQKGEYPLHMVMQRHTHFPYVLTSAVEETEESRDHQPEPTPYLTGEKVRGQQHLRVETDELAPGRGLLTLGGWEKPLAFQDVPHRLVADAIAQIAQGTYNAVIPPRAILTGHAHHEVFQLRSEEHTSELQSRLHLVCRLLLEKKKTTVIRPDQHASH